MLELDRYRFDIEIGGTRDFILYKGYDKSEKNPVLIKIDRGTSSPDAAVERFENDFKIGRSMLLSGAPAYRSMVLIENRNAIVMEYSDGFFLMDFLFSRVIGLTQMLNLFVSIARILDEIHRNGFLHKNISPYVFFIRSDDFSPLIIDFGSASQVPREMGNAMTSSLLGSSLSYISPEQTGRINRSIDSRSDYYSLGIMFYQMLCACLPFDEKDPMELIHSHIAKRPSPPAEIVTTIPAVVSDIIMKMIEKNAEDRYQSIRGLVADLQACIDRYNIVTGTIDPFPIGKEDLQGVFKITENFYGREHEISLILDALSLSSGGKGRAVLISGLPGVGKSSLVGETQRVAGGKNIIFLSGKFDRMKNNIPYSAIVQALQYMVKIFLTKNPDEFERCKEIFLSNLGENAWFINSLVPGFELFLGYCPPLPDLDPAEARSRLNHSVESVFKSIADMSGSFIFFLDDLQWADSASINLLTYLVRDSVPDRCLLIGAYRSDELFGNKTLARFLEIVSAERLACISLYLSPLDSDQISMMIADTLAVQKTDADQLAVLIKKKTEGIPFFVKELLIRLRKENMIFFDDRWKYDFVKINASGISENVVQLLVSRLSRLPERILRVLSDASCIGTSFVLPLLSELMSAPESEISQHLHTAIDEGFVVKFENSYQFVHDKVREAVYLMIDPRTRMNVHYAIATILQQQEASMQGDSMTFTIANQFDLSLGVALPGDRNRLITINLKAGLKAKEASAYETAVEYLRIASSMLGPDSWRTEYELIKTILTELGESEYLAGKMDEAHNHLDEVLENVIYVTDKVRVYEIKIAIYTSVHEVVKALHVGQKALRLLDVEMPRKAGKLSVLVDIIIAKIKYGLTNSVNELEMLHLMTDHRDLAVSRLLMACAEPAFIGEPDYYPVIIFKLLSHSSKKGNSKYAAFAYVNFALILCAVLKDFNAGYRLGRFAIDLIKKLESRDLKSKIFFIFGNTINHWKNHIRDDFSILQEAYEEGIKNGDIAFASYSANYHAVHLFFAGENLSKVKLHYSDNHEVLKKTKQMTAIQAYELWFQLVDNLSGESILLTELNGEFFSEANIVDEWIKQNDLNSLGFYTVGKQLLFYINDEYEKSILYALEGRKAVDSMVGMIFVPQYFFFLALSMGALLQHVEKKVKKRYLKTISSIEKKMEFWARSSPGNYLNKYLLIKAERKKEKGALSEVLALFEESIDHAKKNLFLHEEAIACERAASFLYSKGQHRSAKVYHESATALYGLWGAKWKQKKLESETIKFGN